jgi:hypothetical protein
MHLDTANAVQAAEPRTPTNPTRRAFLFLGIAFAAWPGRGVLSHSPTTAMAEPGLTARDACHREARQQATGDTELDVLRRWALQDPIDELERDLTIYLEQLRSRYASDAYLWHGMERLADRIQAGAATNWPRGARQMYLQIVESLTAPDLPANAERLKARAPNLRNTK